MNIEEFIKYANEIFDKAEENYVSEKNIISDYDELVNDVDTSGIFHTEKVHELIRRYKMISEDKHDLIKNIKTLTLASQNSISLQEHETIKHQFLNYLIELESLTTDAEEVGKQIDVEFRNITKRMSTVLA